jgi:glycosyltransferase involved in cell wall biosynthesis
MNKLSLSLCVITLNEETNIRRCLSSVPFALDIVVLDSGSTDNTKNIAQSLGARVFDEPWRGFGPQKQRSVELAQNDWVLCLDADEELSSELQGEIYHLLSSSSLSYNGYRIPRRSFHLGRWLYFGGWYPDYQTRLFSRSRLQWSDDALHESVKGENIGTLDAHLNHYPFEDLADQVQTNNKYSTIGAETMLKSGKKVYFWHLVIKPWVKFVELYIFKKGFRDGVPGLIVAVGGAYSYFLRFAKMWEKTYLSKDAPPTNPPTVKGA